MKIFLIDCSERVRKRLSGVTLTHIDDRKGGIYVKCGFCDHKFLYSGIRVWCPSCEEDLVFPADVKW